MKIIFIGDLMLGRLVNDLLKAKPKEYVWGDTLPIFEKADLRICNLECVISDKGEPWSMTPKIFHFRTDAKNIEALKAAHINLISLANNHILDYGYEALEECLKILRAGGVRYSGAGINIKEAMRPAFVTIEGITVGMLSFTDNEPSWEAAKRRPGVFYLPIDLTDQRAQRLFKIVESAKKKADLLIVSAHWGPNWGYRPYPPHISFAHQLIDRGADIVFGHSCHVFQGIEIYQGRPIIYSSGDFVDDYAVDEIERNDQSFVFVVECYKDKTAKLELYPTVIRDFQAWLASGEEKEEIAEKMQALCEEFNTTVKWEREKGCLEIIPSSQPNRKDI